MTNRGLLLDHLLAFRINLPSRLLRPRGVRRYKRQSGQNMGGYDSFEGRVIGLDVACSDSNSDGNRDGHVVWRGTADSQTNPSNFGLAQHLAD